MLSYLSEALLGPRIAQICSVFFSGANDTEVFAQPLGLSKSPKCHNQQCGSVLISTNSSESLKERFKHTSFRNLPEWTSCIS